MAIPDAKEAKSPVDSIQSYDTVNNPSLFTSDLTSIDTEESSVELMRKLSKNLTEIVNERYERLCEQDSNYKADWGERPNHWQFQPDLTKADTLLEFWDFMKETNPLGLIGFNSRNFDGPLHDEQD